VEAGIAEVHVLHPDPDPVAAGGLQRLRALGVRVVEVGGMLPHLGREAAHDLRGFLTRVRADRPHVTLKIAQTPDGRTVPPRGGYLTGPAARAHVHVLRADSDAVLVGSGTIRRDDPQLDVRHVTPERAPRPVIVTTRGDVPLAARAIHRGSIVVVGPGTAASVRQALGAAGATVLTVGLDAGAVPIGIDIRAALTALLTERVLTVLAEPGPRLARTLLEGGLVDVVELHVAGGGIASTTIRPALGPLAAIASRARRDGVVTADGDLIVRIDRDGIATDPRLGKVA